VGVIVFLMEHGSDVPERYRLRAAALAEELFGNTEGGGPGGKSERGWKLWKDPESRKLQLEREITLLTGKPVEKTARGENPWRIPTGEKPIGYDSKQIDRLEPHAYRGYRDGSACYICGEKRGHECHTVPVEPKKADYVNEEGYWAGEGNAASGILPICTTTGRICFAWRSPHVMNGNCWGTIGGAVKRGMSPGESAQEELEEETGYMGGLTLHPAYVFADRGFRYFNFIGEVGKEFGLHPMSDSAWETEGLEWITLDEAKAQMAANPDDFHHGVISLFKNSGKLIEQICLKASPKKGKVDVKPNKGNTNTGRTA
jgi:8-oxo-dGTP pyrophosphatase MutT (NUDIX family)